MQLLDTPNPNAKKLIIKHDQRVGENLNINNFQANEIESILTYLDENQNRFGTIAMDIWDYAELGYLERKSTERLQKVLLSEGFEIQSNVADIPTAFVASFGVGEPVIGILAEFDALPGISQSRAATREIMKEKHAGHACGHHRSSG